MDPLLVFRLLLVFAFFFLIVIIAYFTAPKKPRSHESKLNEPVIKLVREKPKENGELEEDLREDSEGDGLMTLGEDDLFFPPEDLDEDE